MQINSILLYRDPVWCFRETNLDERAENVYMELEMTAMLTKGYEARIDVGMCWIQLISSDIETL